MLMHATFTSLQGGSDLTFDELTAALLERFASGAYGRRIH